MDQKQDYFLETFVDLDGFIAEIGEGYWVKIEAKRVEKDQTKPHGIKYSLTLHALSGERVLGYDNAHGTPSKPSITAHDHMHKGSKIVHYVYTDAAKLLRDFWKDVDRILERKK
ncbi:MAG: hypothetical protein BGO67_07545 [Alphaproteobacteria bacterium 41-28]|nr:MAG: hypothetical protein BGO67_07545 [Alphaproteobacteria bacterium 41-28]